MSTVEFLILLASCLTVVTGIVDSGLNLQEDVNVARCRLMCLKTFGKEDVCDLNETRPFPIDECEVCWRMCREAEPLTMEYFNCLLNKSSQSPGENAVCEYKTTTLADKPFSPTMLSEPITEVSYLTPSNVAIYYYYDYKKSRFCLLCYYPECPGPYLEVSWTIVVEGNAIYQYTDRHWKPKYQILATGPLIEATVSWEHADPHELKIRHYAPYDNFSGDISKLTVYRDSILEPEYVEENRKPYTVSWQPEGDSPLGHLISMSYSAQITLLPGTKYYVRVAEDEGPGSDVIVIDTTNYTRPEPSPRPSPSPSPSPSPNPSPSPDSSPDSSPDPSPVVTYRRRKTFVEAMVYTWSQSNVYTLITLYAILVASVTYLISAIVKYRRLREKRKLIEA